METGPEERNDSSFCDGAFIACKTKCFDTPPPGDLELWSEMFTSYEHLAEEKERKSGFNLPCAKMMINV